MNERVKPLTAEQAEQALILTGDLAGPWGAGLNEIAEGRHTVIDTAELEQLRADARLSVALDAFEHETRQLPVGHECPEKGWSTYIWRMHAVHRIRGLMAEVIYNISANAEVAAAQQKQEQEQSDDQ